MKYKCSVPMEKSKPSPSSFTINSINPLPEIPANALAQRRAADEIQIAEKNIYEFEQIYNISNDAQIHDDMYRKIESLQNEVKAKKDKIDKLKRNTTYAQKYKEKKLKQLIENKKVVYYDKSKKSPLLFKHLDLYENIYDCMKFGSADAKR